LQTSTQKRKQKLVILGFAISVLLLLVLGNKISWSQVYLAISQASWLPWLPLAVFVYLLGMLLRGARLKALIASEANVSLNTASNIVAIGYAVNNLIPARLGELARAGVLAERTGLPYPLTLMTTILERLLDGLAILATFFIASFFLPATAWLRPTALIAGSIFALAISFILFLTYFPQLAMAITWKITAPFHASKNNQTPGINANLHILSEMIRGLAAVKEGQKLLLVCLLSILIWCCEALMFALIMPCFSLLFSYPRALAVMAITNLGILIPSSPGYIGSYHAFCCQALEASATMGAPSSLIDTQTLHLSYAVVVHLIFYLTVTVWGVLAMTRYGIELGETTLLSWQAKSMAALTNTAGLITPLPRPSANPMPSAFWLCLSRAVLPDEDEESKETESGAAPNSKLNQAKTIEQAASFLLRQISALPRSLRFLFNLGMIAFKSYVFFTAGCAFEKLSKLRQKQLVNGWLKSKFTPARRLFKIISSLLFLSYFDEIELATTSSRQEEKHDN
jgi:uncharacterized protein (TIRG00374 family)